MSLVSQIFWYTWKHGIHLGNLISDHNLRRLVFPLQYIWIMILVTVWNLTSPLLHKLSGSTHKENCILTTSPVSRHYCYYYESGLQCTPGESRKVERTRGYFLNLACLSNLVLDCTVSCYLVCWYAWLLKSAVSFLVALPRGLAAYHSLYAASKDYRPGEKSVRALIFLATLPVFACSLVFVTCLTVWPVVFAVIDRLLLVAFSGSMTRA